MHPATLFESRVVLDGSQTGDVCEAAPAAFESRVVLDGSQTPVFPLLAGLQFESRVVLDGSQTERKKRKEAQSLRVVLF